ncbi:MAG: hypothetical protein IRY99_01405 [Isosphaeraceae bacterium]|nr:hypothetical protein [Isosphaeraceae bacterium]
MTNANVTAGANHLKHALRDLMEKWEATKATWNDQVRRDFEERQLVPLESAVNAALNGMQELAEVLGRVRFECSDRNDSSW